MRILFKCMLTLKFKYKEFQHTSLANDAQVATEFFFTWVGSGADSGILFGGVGGTWNNY